MAARARRGVAAIAVCVVLAASGACNRGGGDDAAGIALDGTPREPDAAGVVLTVSRDELVLEGGKTYRVSPRLQSFSSQTLEPVSVLQRKGQYVHVGLDGDTAVWVAAVGSVLPGESKAVYYPGRVRSLRGDVLTLEDGTVFRLGDGVRTDGVVAKAFVQIEIDPDANEVRSIQVGT